MITHPNTLGFVSQSARMLVALAMFWGHGAVAQMVDRIDVSRANEREAEIRIVFDTQLQYQRHSPLNEGELLRVFLRFVALTGARETPIAATKQGPRTELVEPFSVMYPETDALVVKFSRATRYRVRQGPDGRSISVFVQIADQPDKEARSAAIPPMPTAPTPVAPQLIEANAASLLAEASKALSDGKPAIAVDALNRLLNLPPNASSESAQALVGRAREENSEPSKARAEYELYLKLYPQGAQAESVGKRLAGLGEVVTVLGADGRVRLEEGGAKWVLTGSLLQYYYAGQSQIEIAENTPGLTFNRSTLTNIDQRALVTTLDFNARRRDAVGDTRIVVRDTHTANFLATLPDRNRLNAAYVEHTDRRAGYLLRAGRQPATNGGVLGRFDGLWVGYKLADRWRLNFVTGNPVDFGSPYKKSFYGVNLDLLPQVNRWGGNLYLIQQVIDGVVDRRAVGVETRYFDERRTLYGLLDYDATVRRVNIAMLQGNWQIDAKTNYLFLADHRKTPPFSVTNGLIGQPIQSVATFVGAFGEPLLRDQSRRLTASSNLVMIGATHQYTERWQLGGDVRVSSISGTQQVGDLPGSPGTGNIVVYSVQAIGNKLIRGNDFGVGNLSLISAPQYDGRSISLNYVNAWNSQLRIELALRYYDQNDSQDVHLRRTTPSIKASYRIREGLSVESEGSVEFTTVQGPTQIEKTRRYFMYLGYRWDLY